VTRYELLDRIGVGGMAEIFRGKAVAAGGFEKPVAIKRILPHLSQDRRFVELLIAEAKVLSLLKHRNIVQIFDVGLGDDGQYFLVMEFVDGKDLGAAQRALEHARRRLPFDLVLHIGAEICEALEHAHTSRGPDGKPMALVHRDVSPSNVLLSRAGEVKLTDFGIAKRAEQDVTQGGAVRGKFAYISPEQARNEPLDPRSDVFSVGILMWELACNRRLFSGLDDLAALRAVREANVPRPSDIDRSLPPEFDQLVMSALARDKTRRFASSGQLGQKLRSLRYSLEVTSGDPATELAKIIDSTEEVERQSQEMIAPQRPSARYDFDVAEATVIRISTAAEFSARDNDASISQARQVIDRFEEEETRLAALSSDQMRMLRRARRDSEDEMTRARAPLDLGKLDSYPPEEVTGDATKLIAPRERRTPPGIRTANTIPRNPRPSTAPPPMPARPRGPTPGPPLPGLPPAARDSQPPPLATTPGRDSQPTPPGRESRPVMPMAPMPQPPGVASSLASAANAPNAPGPAAAFPPPASASFPSWNASIAPQRPLRDATPTVRDSFDQPVFPRTPSVPQVAGFGGAKRQGLKTWVLVVGALMMALLAFLITRAFIG